MILDMSQLFFFLFNVRYVSTDMVLWIQSYFEETWIQILYAICYIHITEEMNKNNNKHDLYT